MSLARKFLDWRRPALPQAVEFLIQKYGTPGQLDLSNVVVVLPGSRAARRLLELVVDAAQQHQLRLVPGEFMTIGNLPERLYTAKRPLANDLTQRAAWAQALRSAARDDLLAVVPHPPQFDDVLSWLELGALLSRQHTELAADALDFSHVAVELAKLQLNVEIQRWESLARIQTQYLQLVDATGLWDRQTARLKAIEYHECHLDRELVLLGAVDINRSMRQMLSAVADRVTALVPALETWLDRFDEFGCLAPSAWQDVPLELDDAHIHLVDGPPQQALRVVQCLAAYRGRYRADEITIGVPDENPELIAHIERQLADRGVNARWGPGKELRATLPCQLLDAVAQYLQTAGRDSFASLVRHPDIGAWLNAKGTPAGWLASLDEYLTEHLPQRVLPPWLGRPIDHAPVATLYEHVAQLVAGFPTAPVTLDQFAVPIRQMLNEVYGAVEFDTRQPARRAVWHALQAIFESLDEVAKIPAPLMPKLSAHEALRLVLATVGQQTSAAPAESPAVELLGWLELPLDDAPALIVTSFNDGVVPKSINADPFLPNGIRVRLGLDDNSRRYARDAYAAGLLLASRQQLDLIVAQRSSDGDPLAPSRLLLSGDPETILRRVKRLFRTEGLEAGAELSGPVSPAPTTSTSVAIGLPVPTPEAILAREPQLKQQAGVTTALVELRVTAFRSYLACPYRFFLQQILKLGAASDEARELDPLAFGTLMHNVLREFGLSDWRDSSDPDRVRDLLRGQLDELAKSQFGSQPLPAVRVQLKQMQLRLDRFAEVQAQRASEGWRIVHVESEKEPLKVNWPVDELPLALVGRIDRIDQNSKTGELAVLDYKTSQSGDDPEKTHRRSKQWVDLQLPLYRYLAPLTGLSGPMRMGYVLLPGDATRAGFAMAEWSDSELQEADEMARHVVRQLRQLCYWPRSHEIHVDWDDFAGICQSGVMGAQA